MMERVTSFFRIHWWKKVLWLRMPSPRVKNHMKHVPSHFSRRQVWWTIQYITSVTNNNSIQGVGTLLSRLNYFKISLPWWLQWKLNEFLMPFAQMSGIAEIYAEPNYNNEAELRWPLGHFWWTLQKNFSILFAKEIGVKKTSAFLFYILVVVSSTLTRSGEHKDNFQKEY